MQSGNTNIYPQGSGRVRCRGRLWTVTGTRTGTWISPGPGPSHFWSQWLVPVLVLVISGPEYWSRSRFNFGPGTGPSPDTGHVACLLKYSYEECKEILAIWSKLDPFRLFFIGLLKFEIQKKIFNEIVMFVFLIIGYCLVVGHGPGPGSGPGPGPGPGPRPKLVPVPSYFWSRP